MSIKKKNSYKTKKFILKIIKNWKLFSRSSVISKKLIMRTLKNKQTTELAKAVNS